jgi:hypothetical protein
MTTTPEQIEAVARAMSRVDWCGAKFNGEFCLCDDPRLDDDVRVPECFCRLQAPAAITAMRPFIRAEALEEAAKVAGCAPYNKGGIVCGCSEGLGNWTAAAIRALKEKP